MLPLGDLSHFLVSSLSYASCCPGIPWEVFAVIDSHQNLAASVLSS